MKGISSAVGFAAKLKPEIRLAQAISEFNASLSNKNQRTRFKNLKSQSPPTSDDIIRITEEINRDGARAHRSWRPCGTRLVVILERMRQFAPIGDVLVGGSQNLIACGVWAVVRLSLETSLSFLSYFENVTSMMMRLGRSLSLHKDFAMLFPKCPTLQSFMCEYTIVMVNICAQVVRSCAKSALSQLAASLTSTFDATFKPLESDLSTWAQLIEKRVTVLLADADLQNQTSVLERLNRLQVTMSQESANRQKDARRHRLLAALCPDQGEFNLIWRRERKRGTSSWLYEQDEYKKWLSSDKRSILWLKGNLGSGKTVAMASAAAHLILATPEMEPQGAVTVSYFFCQSNNPKTLSAATLLGSIVGQVLQNLVLESSFKSFLEKTEIERDICAKLEDYIDILLKSTPPNWRGILILDGLDEMLQEDVDDVFGQLKRLEGHRRIHLLCSSRPTSTCYSIAKSNLGVQWTLSMETADRSDEIRAYIATEISRWNDIRPLPAELQRLVEEQLVAGCQGMFLWLSLQIEDICPRYTQELRSDAEILDILGNLPKDLPEAFDKALLRMRDGKCGTKLFKLVTSAEPPLNLDELRVAFNVQPGNTRWDSSTLASSGKALVSAYGGSLLDIDEEDLRVRFIHYSVLLHLTAPSSDAKTSIFHFDLSEAESMLGAVCVTYLNYSVFENRISTAQKISFGRVPQTTAGSVASSEGSRKAFTLLVKHGRQRDTKVDLERLSYELQKAKSKVRDDVHLFLEYAQDKWLSSTRKLSCNDRHAMLSLWKNLLSHPIVSDSLPWDDVAEAAEWALKNDHATLFQHYLYSEDEVTLAQVISAASRAVSTELSSIRLRGEGLGWLGPIYLLYPGCRAPILRAFIELGCQPFKPNPEHPPPYFIAEFRLHHCARDRIVIALKSYPHEPGDENYILFLSNYLLNPSMFVNDDYTLLDFAISYGCLPLAFELLSKGANPDGGRKASGSLGPLQISIKRGYMGLAQRLVELGADITAGFDDDTFSFQSLALNDSNWGLLSALLVRGAFSANGKYGPNLDTACHLFCERRPCLKSSFSEVDLKVLIERGADINVRNKAGETPLMLAVSTNKVRSTKILLEHGADPNICDNLGARPLHFAQDSEIVQDLLHRGADPNVEAIGHLTPLMVAAYRGRAEIVSALLKRYADPEACLDADIITSKELLLLDWRGEATTRPEPGATALHLSAWRLERELKALSRCSHRAKHPDYYAAIRLCSGLVFIVMEILNLGIGYRAQYYEMLKRLSEALRVGANEVETLAAGLRGARKLVETTIRLSAQLSH